MHRKDSTQAWADLTLALRWLSNRLRCCVCILLHAQKSGAAPRGPVGHLLADCDAELKAIARENNQCEVQVLKQRGGSAGFSYIFDVVPVALPSGSQPVIVLRGRADEEVRRPTTPREAATAERDSAWLMRLARALEDGERSPPSGVLMRAWGGDGGNQLARMRRLVPFDEGVTIHIPDDGVMKTIMLVIEDSQELLCCTARPAVVGGTPRTASSEETPEDVVPEDHADGDDVPVPRGHMTPREARWFLHFQHAFSASPPDERRYTMLIGNPRLPVFTQDREAGSGACTTWSPTATIPQCVSGRVSRSVCSVSRSRPHRSRNLWSRRNRPYSTSWISRCLRVRIASARFSEPSNNARRSTAISQRSMSRLSSGYANRLPLIRFAPVSYFGGTPCGTSSTDAERDDCMEARRRKSAVAGRRANHEGHGSRRHRSSVVLRYTTVRSSVESSHHAAGYGATAWEPVVATELRSHDVARPAVCGGSNTANKAKHRGRSCSITTIMHLTLH